LNLAFPVLLVFIIALPGVIFRYYYRKGGWPAPLSVRPLTEEIAYGLLLSLLFHSIWILLSDLAGYNVRVDYALMLLSNNFGKDQLYYAKSIQSITAFSHLIFIYFISLYLISAFLGFMCHTLVRKFGLDRRFPELFKFNNDWYYLFSGEYLDFNGEDSSEIMGVYITVVVQLGDENYLYRGILSNYFFDKQGQLDRIVLEYAHRRKLSDDHTISDAQSLSEEHRYYMVRGNYLTIRYPEIKTLNVDYIRFKTTEEK